MGAAKVLTDHVPTFDSTVVAKLEAAGAVLLGKLNLTEGAMGGYNPEFDIPKNPWNPDRWTGSSSSGSGVATAAGFVFRFAWERYRRLHPFSLGIVWHCRYKTDVGQSQPVRCARAC